MRILIDTEKKRFAKADNGGQRTAPSNFEPNIIQRIGQGVKYIVSGVTPMTWFGPAQPIQPVAQQAQGRLWDYPVGYNLQIQKRPYEGISFEAMRLLADNYDILRLVIETRKDQIARMEWRIKPYAPRNTDTRVGIKPTAEIESQIKEVYEMLLFPDREHNWDQWLRMVVEDMLVIDAATIYPRKTKGGAPFSFEIMDGATIKLILDERGRTPEPPSVAYQQILKGIPAVDYTRDEIIYFPRNLRSSHVYGYSPVEQIIRTVNIGIRRMVNQLYYFTEGNIPEAFVGVPESWTTDQIKSFQMYWDDLHEGNLAQRRHARFVPGEISKNIHETKAAPLQDEFDEWLARIVCYAFSVSWQWAVKMMNRSTSETAQKMAQEEGLEPLLRWIKNLMDFIIWKYYGFTGIEFEWQAKEETAPLEQAQIDQIYVTSGIKSRDEIRDRIGLEPMGNNGNGNGKGTPLLTGKEKQPPEEEEDGEEIEAAKLAKVKKNFYRSTAIAK